MEVDECWADDDDDELEVDSNRQDDDKQADDDKYVDDDQDSEKSRQ